MKLHLNRGEKSDFSDLLCCQKALEMAIEKLKEYADADDVANMNGYGCYSKPHDKIKIWITEIKAVRDGTFY